MSMGAMVFTMVTMSEGRISPKASDLETLAPHFSTSPRKRRGSRESTTAAMEPTRMRPERVTQMPRFTQRSRTCLADLACLA